MLSVVVCTHDRPAYTQKCLESLAGQPGITVLVVDSGSPSSSAEQLAAMARDYGARLIRLDQPGVSEARNTGLAEAGTDWIAYIDDDARAAPDWSATVADAIASLPETAGALGGAILPHWEAPCPSWFPPELVPALTILDWGRAGRVGDGRLPKAVEPWGANMVFRTAALRRIGGFPGHLGRVGTNLLSAEETWVMRGLRRAGFTVHYDPRIKVRHSIQAKRLTPNWLVSRQYWSGLSEAIVAADTESYHVMIGKALRLLLHIPARSLLLLRRSGEVDAMRNRCALAFAAGYVRGAAVALGR